MTEYIERDAAVKIAEKYGTCNGSVLGRHSDIADIIASRIDAIPAADVAPVVHGEWVFKFEGAYKQRKGYCSVCGQHSGIGGIQKNQAKPFCPNCGAKTNGGADDAAD